jgi:hypothetical protein
VSDVRVIDNVRVATWVIVGGPQDGLTVYDVSIDGADVRGVVRFGPEEFRQLCEEGLALLDQAEAPR